MQQSQFSADAASTFLFSPLGPLGKKWGHFVHVTKGNERDREKDTRGSETADGEEKS